MKPKQTKTSAQLADELRSDAKFLRAQAAAADKAANRIVPRSRRKRSATTKGGAK